MHEGAWIGKPTAVRERVQLPSRAEHSASRLLGWAMAAMQSNLLMAWAGPAYLPHACLPAMQRTPSKVRFFQLSYDGSTLRWGWNKCAPLLLHPAAAAWRALQAFQTWPRPAPVHLYRLYRMHRRFVRLYYIDDLACDDVALTITLTFPFDAELVLKFRGGLGLGLGGGMLGG